MADTLKTLDARLAALAAEKRRVELQTPTALQPDPLADPDPNTEIGKVQIRMNALLEQRLALTRKQSVPA